jgi:ATP-dependent Clp protease ATP-binding subunit ClpA
MVEDKLADLILSGEIEEGSNVKFDVVNEEFVAEIS